MGGGFCYIFGMNLEKAIKIVTSDVEDNPCVYTSLIKTSITSILSNARMQIERMEKCKGMSISLFNSDASKPAGDVTEWKSGLRVGAFWIELTVSIKSFFKDAAIYARTASIGVVTFDGVNNVKYSKTESKCEETMPDVIEMLKEAAVAIPVNKITYAVSPQAKNEINEALNHLSAILQKHGLFVARAQHQYLTFIPNNVEVAHDGNLPQKRRAFETAGMPILGIDDFYTTTFFITDIEPQDAFVGNGKNPTTQEDKK